MILSGIERGEVYSMIREKTYPLEQEIRALRREVADLRSQIVVDERESSDYLSTALTPEEAFFQEIREKYPSSDAKTRQKVQGFLNKKWKRKSITEAMIVAFKSFLKERRWGIRCPGKCGAAASPVWQKDDSCVEKGYLRLAHIGSSSKTVIHRGMTALEEDLILVEKVDRRRKCRPDYS